MIQRKLFEKIKPFFKRENPGKWDVDRSLILIVAAIILLGFVVLSSATLSYGNRPFLIKQGVATLLGAAIACGLMLVDYRIWRSYYPFLYGLSVLLLVATLLFGHGDTTWGSKSWLAIGPINFQPAEFVKIFLVICFAFYLEAHG
ncbi:MAG: FtsW/RodA/SpoVE family cell cycle protein, partial [Aedoeadaptatus pacaensis]